MRFDIHTHTARYSACSPTPPEEMMAAAVRYGLDGVVLTEHNMIWEETEWQNLQAAFPDIIILRGIEVRVASGDDFLVFGICDPDVFHPYMDVGQLLQRVEALGGAAILAHPYRYSDEVPREIFYFPLHGIESMSSNIRRHMQGRIASLRQRLGVPATAASDAHQPEAMGLYGIDVFDQVTTEKELAQALRQGCFRPFADESRINQINNQLRKQIPLIRKLMDHGYSNEDIKRKYGFSASMLAALRAGREIELLTSLLT